MAIKNGGSNESGKEFLIIGHIAFDELDGKSDDVAVKEKR